MDWRQAEIFDLICMYRESECLWNCLNPEYKDVDLKKNAWKEIANFFGRKVEEVKKKIKNLRTGYVIEKKKTERRKKSSGDALYEPRLFYYDEMTFLDPVIVLRIINPTEQSSNHLTEIKPRRFINDSPIIAEKKKRKVVHNTQEDMEDMVDMADSQPSPTKRLRDVRDDIQLDNELPEEKGKKTHKRKEETFCAMLCSELKLLKSEDIYDNVTSEIFTILKNAKMAERQIVYQPEEVKVASNKK